MEKYIPIRTCIVCRIKKSRNELLRFIKQKKEVNSTDITKSDEYCFVLDEKKVCMGRGFYLCTQCHLEDKLSKIKTKKPKTKKV